MNGLVKLLLASTYFLSVLATPVFAGPLSDVPNPLGDRFSSIGVIISRLLPSILLLAGMLALLFIIWGGIRYMTSRGDPKAIDSAKNILQTAVIGLLIILLSGVIYRIIADVFKIQIFSFVRPAYAACLPGSDFSECLPFANTFNSFADLISAIIRIALMAGGLIFFFMLIWGGFKYLSAGGNPENAEAARSTLQNAIIGLLIVVVSFVIVEFISTVLKWPGIFS